jgi:hypothetical protein
MKIPCDKLPRGCLACGWYASNFSSTIHVFKTKPEAMKFARVEQRKLSGRFSLWHVDWIPSGTSARDCIGGVGMLIADHREGK